MTLRLPRIDFSLHVGAYLRIHWMKIFYDKVDEVRSHGVWGIANGFNCETNHHHNIGFLNIMEVDERVDYKGVVVCIYSKLPMVTPDRQVYDYHRQYDVIIMGKSNWYCYNEWEELY